MNIIYSEIYELGIIFRVLIDCLLYEKMVIIVNFVQFIGRNYCYHVVNQ